MSFTAGLKQSLKFGRTIYTRCRLFDIESNSSQVSEDLKLTDNCVQRLKSLNIGASFLRVLVEGGGCSGFQYQFDIDDKISDTDRIFHRDGIRVIVDTESLSFMQGSVIDYQEELIKSGFAIVDNPHADQGCSCGASFNVNL